jgi:hypothetical protein
MMSSSLSVTERGCRVTKELQEVVRCWLGGAPPRLACPRRWPECSRSKGGWGLEVPGLLDLEMRLGIWGPVSDLVLLQLGPSSSLLLFFTRWPFSISYFSTGGLHFLTFWSFDILVHVQHVKNENIMCLFTPICKIFSEHVKLYNWTY